MSVAVVIPVFDRVEFLPALLRQLSSQSVLPDHVVIVDHGRQSLSLHGDWPFQVEILKRDSSLWFAAATNEGLVHARTGNPRFLMILNDDVRIGCDHWLARMLADRCIDGLPVGESPRIIDMCCGSGTMLAEIIKATRVRFGSSAI